MMVQSSKTNTYGEEEGNLSEESLPTQLPPNNGTKGKEEKEREEEEGKYQEEGNFCSS